MTLKRLVSQRIIENTANRRPDSPTARPYRGRPPAGSVVVARANPADSRRGSVSVGAVEVHGHQIECLARRREARGGLAEEALVTRPAPPRLPGDRHHPALTGDGQGLARARRVEDHGDGVIAVDVTGEVIAGEPTRRVVAGDGHRHRRAADRLGEHLLLLGR